jgi:tetratricopeptide (TPR) repeat protein
MPHKPRELNRGRHAAGDFLILDAPPKREADATLPRERVLGAFKGEFPETLAGEAFVHAALGRVKGGSKFAVLGISVDSPHGGAPAASIVDAGRLVMEAVGPEGFWGLWDMGVLAAVLPGAGEGEARAAAERLMANARESGMGTLSVGLALYPVLDLTREDILRCVEKTLAHAAFLGPDALVVLDSVTLNISGDQLYQAGQIEKAIEEYRRSLLLDPANETAQNSLGVALAVSGETGKALELFDKSRALAPKDIMPVYNTGLVLFNRGEADKALSLFLEAEAMEPGVFEVLYQTSRVLLELGRAGEAVETAGKAVAKRPESAAAHRMLGDAFALLGACRDASKEYERTLRQCPNDSSALSGLAWMYLELGENLDIALSFARQSIALAPGNGLFHFRLGRIHEARGEGEAAREAHARARELGYVSGAFPGEEGEA